MAARAIATGTMSFGLVSVPFKVYTATSPTPKQIGFNLLHKKCGSRLRRNGTFCPICNVSAPRPDMIRAFEYARDQYVTFTDEDLRGLEAARTDQLELIEFVPEETVPALSIERTYYLGPDKGGDRAYRLLAESLRRTGRVGVGRFATRGKDHLVLIRSDGARLLLQECFYANEVRSFDDVETGGAYDFKPIEIEMAGKLIDQLSSDRFEPSKYRDQWADAVKNAVERKIAGGEEVHEPNAPRCEVIDLLERLKMQVARAEGRAANDEPPKPSPVPPNERTRRLREAQEKERKADEKRKREKERKRKGL